MAAARRVVEEVLGTCRQTALLALRRSALPTTPLQSTRKSDLIADLAAECDTLANRQRIIAEVLTTWTMHELRLFIARLKGLGCMVAVGKRPRQQDLIAAIVDAREYAARAPAVSKHMRPIPRVSYALGNSQAVCKDVCSSTSAFEKPGPSSEGTSEYAASTLAMSKRKDLCSSASAHKHSSSKEPRPAVEPSSCMALVALDSTAAPLNLQRKLFRHWSKKWAKFTKKKDRKRKLKRVEDELRKALQDHKAAATVGELRTMVGQALGLPLDGKYRVRFDRALSKLQSTPPRKTRARRRFTIAKVSVQTRVPSRRSSRAESA